MIKEFVLDIEKVANKHTIYIHNLSSFDSLFILKALYKIFITKPLFKDNKIISINLKKIIDKNNKINIFFKDSLLLLPISLEKLISAFNIKTNKLPFPYDFFNKDNLNYIGDIPEYVYYSDKLTYKEYSELASNYNNNNP
jgi:DNA polymerase type B, organellar and viral